MSPPLHDYSGPGWLPGGHLQTLWPALFCSRHVDAPPRYRRERWDTPDGDFIDVDWLASPGDVAPVHAGAAARVPWHLGQGYARADAVPRPQPPLLVLFHGLEGSSRSHYALAFADAARRLGWRLAVPHFRGCSGEINRAPRAYHSGDFEEIGWILARCRAEHGGPLLAVGVSLGGNALMRWAAEAGDSAAALVRAVCAVSAPLDLMSSGQALGRGANRWLYTPMFLRTMKPKALTKLAQYPGLFERRRLLAARTLQDFDDVFTAPLHGFRDAHDYWTRAAARPHLGRVRLPALLVNACNDPFVPAHSLPVASDVSAATVLARPAHGGHVGFAAGRFPAHVLSLPEAVTRWLVQFV